MPMLMSSPVDTLAYITNLVRMMVQGNIIPLQYWYKWSHVKGSATKSPLGTYANAFLVRQYHDDRFRVVGCPIVGYVVRPLGGTPVKLSQRSSAGKRPALGRWSDQRVDSAESASSSTASTSAKAASPRSTTAAAKAAATTETASASTVAESSTTASEASTARSTTATGSTAASTSTKAAAAAATAITTTFCFLHFGRKRVGGWLREEP